MVETDDLCLNRIIENFYRIVSCVIGDIWQYKLAMAFNYDTPIGEHKHSS